jgi:competence CoiA-like predicted nuclease
MCIYLLMRGTLFCNYPCPLLPQDSSKSPFSFSSFPWLTLTHSDFIWLWTSTPYYYFWNVCWSFIVISPIGDLKLNLIPSFLREKRYYSMSTYPKFPGAKSWTWNCTSQRQLLRFFYSISDRRLSKFQCWKASAYSNRWSYYEVFCFLFFYLKLPETSRYPFSSYLEWS